MRRFAPEGDWTRDTMAYASGHGSAGVLLHAEFVGQNRVIEGHAFKKRTFHLLDDFYNFFPQLLWDQVRLILACGCHLAQWKFIESPESDFSCSVAKVT